MSGLTSVDGLISGLNTTEIIDSIMAAEGRSVIFMQARRERYSNQILSYQSMTAKLLAVKADADALARSSTFDARSSTSSDTDILTVSAAARAPVGSYDLTVTAIARSHQVGSQGLADTDTTTVGTGTLDLTVDGDTTTVTVDTSNNTLDGLRDAINLAGTDVKATIINDGGDTYKYRLLLTSAATGTDNTISITNNLSGGATPVFTSNSITAPVADSGNTYAGTATAAGSYAGTSGRTYTVEFVAGGGLGVATYKVSEDGGTTWGTTQTLNDLTIDVYDDLNSTDLGAQMTFAAGAFGAGDEFTMRAFVPTVQSAQDAAMTMGSGSGAINITSSSNRIADALPGLTIDLQSADATETVTVEVTNDKAAIRTRVTGLISNFNGAVDYITANSSYDSTTGVAGLFLGDTTMMRIQSDLRNAVFSTVTGTTKYDSLFSVGMTVSDTASLSINTTTLDTALDENFDDVAKIFQITGESTNNKISFLTASSDTVETTTGYDVDITQAATRGKITGSSIDDPAITPLVIDATNNQIIVTVDGAQSQILQLTEATYNSGADLARDVQTTINNDSYLSGKEVSVTFVDEGATGYFEIRSEKYGVSSSIIIEEPANSAYSDLGLSGGTTTTGVDVAGTINGEAATGAGQILNANSGNENTDGISLLVTLTSGDLGAGAEGSLTLVKGVGAKLAESLFMWTEPTVGILKMREDIADDQIESVDNSIARGQEVLATKRARLVAQFTAMEQALAMMQTQSTFLGIQLAALMNQSSSTS